jgi:hypothetical protein
MPDGTSCVLKKKEIKQFGDVIYLESWDALNGL